jgi:hypothetical protein
MSLSTVRSLQVPLPNGRTVPEPDRVGRLPGVSISGITMLAGRRARRVDPAQRATVVDWRAEEMRPQMALPSGTVSAVDGRRTAG